MAKKSTAAGRLYGVGVGPGNPELLTLKARRVLGEVPVIFVPRRSARDDSMAEAIITAVLPEAAGKCSGIILPMVRDVTKLGRAWQEAADTVWERLSRGEDAAFVNIGDPLFFGTFVHVMNALNERHPGVTIEVVPGIPSVNAAAAGAVMPLTIDGESLAVLSGLQSDAAIREALERYATVAIVKASAGFDRIAAVIEAMNMTEHCILVRRCSTGDEEIVRDIRTLKGKKIDYFSLLLIRKPA